jgi:5'-methylthioadenosine phosphorylase
VVCITIEGIQILKTLKWKLLSETLLINLSQETLKEERCILTRHGKTHNILPSELNFRANIYGMKKLGVERIIAVSAVGSMKEEIKPLDIVIPDQFIDRTQG